MKIGPGVDTTLVTHVFTDEAGAMFVQHHEEGVVRIMFTNGEDPLPTGANLRGDITLTADCAAHLIEALTTK